MSQPSTSISSFPVRLRGSSPSSSPLAVDSGPPIGPPFVESDEYLLDCVSLKLRELAESFNSKVIGCGAWHSAVLCLSEECTKLKLLHTCTDKCTPEEVS
eukprot:gnl/TRDRNA2_/TRDRNA2_163718_c1_seq1.p4 gnl/TRDRNA2_/TRDRNA2_163718_c1~~gnl/TRDRNA2_/TRDRNA2_163718_c1_seq1.p4  ORF type:complete len:100 (-),score=12.92 gnl/TRDRNA2_/TRDRNA2_163718_c1_seq1:141-440(-)